MSAYDLTYFLRTAYRPFVYCVPPKHPLNTAYQKGGCHPHLLELSWRLDKKSLTNKWKYVCSSILKSRFNCLLKYQYCNSNLDRRSLTHNFFYQHPWLCNNSHKRLRNTERIKYQLTLSELNNHLITLSLKRNNSKLFNTR